MVARQEVCRTVIVWVVINHFNWEERIKPSPSLIKVTESKRSYIMFEWLNCKNDRYVIINKAKTRHIFATFDPATPGWRKTLRCLLFGIQASTGCKRQRPNCWCLTGNRWSAKRSITEQKGLLHKKNPAQTELILLKNKGFKLSRGIIMTTISNWSLVSKYYAIYETKNQRKMIVKNIEKKLLFRSN